MQAQRACKFEGKRCGFSVAIVWLAKVGRFRRNRRQRLCRWILKRLYAGFSAARKFCQPRQPCQPRPPMPLTCSGIFWKALKLSLTGAGGTAPSRGGGADAPTFHAIRRLYGLCAACEGRRVYAPLGTRLTVNGGSTVAVQWEDGRRVAIQGRHVHAPLGGTGARPGAVSLDLGWAVVVL